MLSTPRTLLRLATAFLLTTALDAAPVTLTAPLPEVRATVAALKARGPLPAGGVIVEIPAGVYPLSSTLALTAADSGTAEAPVAWRAARGARVILTGGACHRAVSCASHDLALGAIRVAGGDRTTLTPSHHEILNHHIHDFSQWLRTGPYGVLFDGVGQRVAHHLIHDAPFEALYQRGNDHVLEFNEVYRVGTETGDSGAIHTGRDFTWQGNIIRHNYWHDLQGPGLHGVTAVYLDDFSSGYKIHGNVFYHAGRAVQLGGGRDNTVANNLFVECDPAVHLDARGLGWARNYFNGDYPWLFDRCREMHGDQPPYATRYPRLKTILQDEPAVPKGNVVQGNVSWGSGRRCDVYDFCAFDFHRAITMRDNLVANAGLMRRRDLRLHQGPALLPRPPARSRLNGGPLTGDCVAVASSRSFNRLEAGAIFQPSTPGRLRRGATIGFIWPGKAFTHRACPSTAVIS